MNRNTRARAMRGLPRCERIGVIGLFIALLLAWTPVVTAESPAGMPGEDWIVTSRPGERLQDIAERHLAPGRHWTELVRYNQIAEPFVLSPGTRIRVPVAWMKQNPEVVRVVNTDGDVWVRRAGQTSLQPARAGEILQTGDELRTRNGSARLRFGDGSEIDLAAHTEVIFNRLTRYGESEMTDTRFKLVKGRIENRVTPREQPAGRYEVTTPGAVAAVRGTVFRIAADGSETRTEVVEGRVEIRTTADEALLQAGEGAIVGRGAVTPVALPPAPSLQLPDRVDTLPLALSWSPVAGAIAYRLMLSKAPSGALLHDTLLQTPEARFDQLDNGVYRLTLRSVGSDGLEGPDLAIEFTVERTSAPATLTVPEPEARLELPAPFRWQSGSAGTLHSLEIAATPAFTTLVGRTPFATTTSARLHRELPPGRYYWRVATLTGGEALTYSEVRPVLFVGSLPTTRVIAVNYDGKRARVFWRRVPQSQGYQVQVAADETFRFIQRELTLQESHATLELDPEQTWYVRVKPVGSPLALSRFGEHEALRIPSP